jgi:glycosyltransferase involved in cell wall biosynthesis
MGGYSAVTRKFYFDQRGNWSGGGQAFLRNARLAEAMFPNIFAHTDTAVPIVPRNRPAAGRMDGPLVLSPQNAWPYGPAYAQGAELLRWHVLRFETRRWTRRAEAVLRISEAVLSPIDKSSPVIHNVLDDSFEETLARLDTAGTSDVGPTVADGFVSIGSMTRYRNFARLLDAYGMYRAAGGSRPLYLVGSGSKDVQQELVARAKRIPGASVLVGRFSRLECLQATRAAGGVVLPSAVEASPFSLLEAVALNANVALSNIPGNMGMMTRLGDVDSVISFSPEEAADMANGLLRLDRNVVAVPGHSQLADREFRDAEREKWCRRVAEWLSVLEVAR